MPCGTRQHVHNGVGRIKTEKSGGTVTTVVPMLPTLQQTLDAGPCGDLTFIVGADSRPMTKESFGNAFRDACRAAGVPGSAHGVRKIAATTAANNGATTSQLKALFGWTSDAMPSICTKAADRERLGREAGNMLANVEPTSIPSPRGKGMASGLKGQSSRRQILAVGRSGGLEPPRVAPLAPQASASTNSATAANERGPGGRAPKRRRSM